MNENTAKWDVVIIGLGPIGATLANLLGRYNIKTLVLERQSAAFGLPRAVMFDDEVMRVFQSMKLSEAMSNIAEVGGGAKFVDAEGNVLVNWHRPRELSPNGWFVNYRFHQPELEKELHDNLKNFRTVEILWNAEVVALNQDEKSVSISYLDKSSGEQRVINAEYAVGCDGSRSFVREYISADIIDLGFHEPWLVIDIIMKQPDHQIEPESIHFCEHERASTYVYLGSKRKRWEFRLTNNDNPNDVTDPSFIWSLLKRWVTPSEAILERSTVYTFHSLIAEQWHRGRLLIAGDAAHQTPPFMGQGMCAGIRDVANLAWKMDRIINAKAPDKLLDTYQTERIPHVREFIELTIQMGELINRTRNQVISSNAGSPDSGPQTLGQLKPLHGPGLTAGCPEHRGELFPQPQLANGKKLDDEIGSNSAVIIDYGLDMGNLSHLNKITNSNIKVLQDSSVDLKRWFRKSQVNAVLIRPDRYILGSARNPSDLKGLISEAIALGL